MYRGQGECLWASVPLSIGNKPPLFTIPVGLIDLLVRIVRVPTPQLRTPRMILALQSGEKTNFGCQLLTASFPQMEREGWKVSHRK